jgi:hypothetical protein
MSRQRKKVKETREQWEARITDIWEKDKMAGKHVSDKEFSQRKKKILGNLTIRKT